MDIFIPFLPAAGSMSMRVGRCAWEQDLRGGVSERKLWAQAGRELCKPPGVVDFALWWQDNDEGIASEGCDLNARNFFSPDSSMREEYSKSLETMLDKAYWSFGIISNFI